MVTLSQYIRLKMDRFSVNVSDSEIECLADKYGFLPTEEYSQQNDRAVRLAIASMIPELVLVPNISEDGYSISRDRAALVSYYRMLCSELGIENQLTPKVRNRSYLW